MQNAGQWLLMLFVSLAMAVNGAFLPIHAADEANSLAPAPAAQNSAELALISPDACPSGGCAAGQRISMRFAYTLNSYDSAKDPDIEVCLYAPQSWGVDPSIPNGVTPPTNGAVTNAAYIATADQACGSDTQKPANYRVIYDGVTNLDSNLPSDALDFSFRLGTGASGSGQILARLFEHDATGTWQRTANVTSPILATTPAASPAFVANDAAACGLSSPCYINSAGDGANGIGTGLKDAVDSLPDGSILQVKGAYSVKANPVIINRPMTIQGVENATITFNGPGACSTGSALLKLSSQVTIQDLNINDGVCTSPNNRRLLEVDSSSAVNILSNNLASGDNAIYILDNSGPVTVNFNNITGNSGYAVYEDNHQQNGALTILGNNLSGNRSGSPVDCSGALGTATTQLANRRTDHNFWGGSLPDPVSLTHCNISAGKRLGMPIAPRSGLPGADIQLVTVKQNTEYKYDNQIGYARSGGDDYPLYIVNHGFNAAGGPPFSYALGGESLMPCSNYWDLFLPDGVQPNGTLELYLKYNRSSACIATINSSQYCDQNSDITKYPLYWYDPATNATTWWDPMGKRPENLSSGDGQSVSCNTSSNEIHATIDNSGRPNLSSDFGYLPVMVGVPVIKNFTPLASNGTVTVTWTTNNETDINGFYVLRGQDSSNLNPITDLITHTGTALAGKSYSFTDSNRTNGVTYYYRLQIVRTDGTSIYSDIKSVAANVATKTPIITPSPTVTRTPILVTATRTPTRIPTQYPTRIPTKSPTPAFSIRATATFSIYPTLTYNPFTETPGIFDTLTAQAPTVEPSMTSETATPSMEVVTGSPEATLLTRTATPTVSGTPMLPSTSTASPDQNPWLSLVFGLLAGVGATGAVAGVWWYANPGRPKR